MGIFKKVRNSAEKALGQAKEQVGKHTDNRDLEFEGKKDQAKANLKGTGESLKDKFGK
jgi:uncharacterized protein YjbJ (UPF0337 family)